MRIIDGQQQVKKMDTRAVNTENLEVDHLKKNPQITLKKTHSKPSTNPLM